MNQSRSAIANRQKQLMNYIRENKTVSVAEASQLLGVSELTIRRDMAILESQDQIKRYHGGASFNEEFADHETLLEEKRKLNEHLKNAIGACVAEYLPAGSTIFLNSGTTALSVLKHLNGKHIRVVTNNAFAPAVVRDESIELIMTGGECRSHSKSLVGSFALNTINSVISNFCILGANGISAIGLTTSVYAETQINEAMVNRCSGKVIVVADGTKIGKSHNFISIPLKSIDILITDTTADAEELDRLRQFGIEIMQVSA